MVEEKKNMASLDDIEKKRSGKQRRSSVFKTYRPQNEVGEEICKEFMERRYKSGKRYLGFYLAEEKKGSSGLLTQCTGIMTLSSLFSYGVDISKYKVQIVETVSYILDNTENENYQPTPYLSQLDESNDEEYNFIKRYMDVEASVLSSLVHARKMLYDPSINTDPDIKDLIDRVEDRLISTLKLINRSAILNSNDEEYILFDAPYRNNISGNTVLKYKGWNFTDCKDDEHDKFDPSLYFTYSVTNAYMQLRAHFDNIIKYHRIVKKQTSVEYDQEEIDKLFAELNKTDLDFFNRFSEDFDKYTEICVDAGHYVDTRIRESNLEIAEEFIGRDYVPISVKDVLNSTTNDALYNTLFAIGIMINAGTDLDYLDYSNAVYNNDSKQIEFVENIQYAVKGVERCYKKCVATDKEYVVDQFTLNFSESIPLSLQPQAKVLRQQRMAPTSLKPLIIKITNLLSEYVINYPQKEYVNNLFVIMANRNPQYAWSWDADGYNIFVNYMYVDLLNDFYKYYKKFELMYSGDLPEGIRHKENEYRGQIIVLENKYKGDLAGQKNEYESKISELTDELESLKKQCYELSNKKEPLIELIEGLVSAGVRETYMALLGEIARANYSGVDSTVKSAFNEAVLSWYHGCIDDFIKENPDKGDEYKEYLRDSIIETAKTNFAGYSGCIRKGGSR